MSPNIGDWSELLAGEREMDYFESLYSFLYNNQSKEIYPPKENWYKAFEYSYLGMQNGYMILIGLWLSVTSCVKPLNTKKTTIYNVRNLGPGLGQTQKCGGAKQVNDNVIVQYWRH